MVYKVRVTKEVDEALENIEKYCIEHFQNYDCAQKVFNEILRVASFLSENAGIHYCIQSIYIGYVLK